MESRGVRGLWLSLAVLGFAVGCSASSGARGEDNGVDDVRIACEVRAQWTRTTHVECVSCKTNAASTPCACNPDVGTCHAQAEALANETDCTSDVNGCVENCRADCGCIDACYAAHAACRKVASAMSGCVAETCDAECR